jgi:hypothetical protein
MVLFVDGDHFLTALPCPDQQAVIIDLPNDPTIIIWPELAARWWGEGIVVGLSAAEVNAALASDQGLP